MLKLFFLENFIIIKLLNGLQNKRIKLQVNEN